LRGILGKLEREMEERSEKSILDMSVMELAEHIARRKRKLDADPQAAEVE
jgi:hypothetical protein